MLVKFISYIITVFGTKRYKPVLFASFALVATLVGVNTVFSLYREQPQGTASSINQDEVKDDTSEGLSKQGLQKQAAKVDTEANPTSTPSTDPAIPVTPAATPKTELSIVTTPVDAALSMKRDQNSTTSSQAITAATSDSSKLQWHIDTPVNAAGQPVTGLSAVPVGDKSNASTLSFSMKADSTLQIGQYSVTIHAKDSGRGVDLTKTIIVTITAE